MSKLQTIFSVLFLFSGWALAQPVCRCPTATVNCAPVPGGFAASTSWTSCVVTVDPALCAAGGLYSGIVINSGSVYGGFPILTLPAAITAVCTLLHEGIHLCQFMPNPLCKAEVDAYAAMANCYVAYYQQNHCDTPAQSQSSLCRWLAASAGWASAEQQTACNPVTVPAP